MAFLDFETASWQGVLPRNSALRRRNVKMPTVRAIASNSQGQTMASVNISGSTEITSEGIKKHFKATTPLDALFELAWNGFDAKASEVVITVTSNELGAPTEITISDNGEGVDFNNYESNFGRFNESTKKDDIGQHGSHGRGRLAFHKLAHEAVWFTKTASGEAIFLVSSNDVKHYEVKILEPGNYHGRVSSGSGTLVVLSRVFENIPDRVETIQLLSKEFGWYLALNPNKRLVINGEDVPVPSHELHEEPFRAGSVDFCLKVIRWDDKPSSEKSYTYLLNSADRIVHRQLSTLNNKPNFYTSIFVKSPWADSFMAEGGLFSTNSPDSDEWREVTKKITAVSRGIYEEFLRRLVDSEIAKYEEDGVFPTYSDIPPDYAKWRHENTKSIVRTIYTADPAVFNSLTKKQKKILVRLLDRLSVSNENESLFDVLHSVLDLDTTSVDQLATQLKRTTLENIVATIELLQRRQQAVNELRILMNVHYADVLETPDLQRIIENNTWLFGPQYETLGAEEATFTKIAKALRDSVKDIDRVEDDDVEGAASVDGANRQPDLFLARKLVHFDSFGRKYYRCVIVEIKRPSIALNIKHLRQLDDYAAIIKRHPEFTSENIHFELILLGRKISESDSEIASRMQQQLSRGETGLVTQDPRMKRYVLNWYTLLDGFELANSALLEALKLKRDELSETPRGELMQRLQGAEESVPADDQVIA